MVSREGSRFVREVLEQCPRAKANPPRTSSRLVRGLLGLSDESLQRSTPAAGAAQQVLSRDSTGQPGKIGAQSSSRVPKDFRAETIVRQPEPGIEKISSAHAFSTVEAPRVRPALERLMRHRPATAASADLEIRLPVADKPVSPPIRNSLEIEFGGPMDDLFDQIWVRVQRRLSRASSDTDAIEVEQEIHPHSLQSIIVTSWNVGEGSSTVALGLAARAAAAAQGKICLVDADFHSADLTRSAEMDSRPGLAELLADEVSYDEAIVEGSQEHLYFLPAGRNRSSDALAVDGRVQQVIRRLEERFRYVFFDASSLKRGIEAYRWGRFVVNTVLVVRAGSRRETILHAVNSMRLHGMKLLGTVLNHRVDTIPNWLYPYV